MNILITGGAGFIGSHIADMHINRGDRVFVVDDLSTGKIENIRHLMGHPNFWFEKADIVDWPGVYDVVVDADRIYNMAAVVGMFRVLEQPVEVTRVNTMGCERLLHAVVVAGHRPQVVLPSSSSVYGTARYEDLHEGADIVAKPGAPLLNYALSKLSNEVQARSYHESHGIPVVAARLFNTVGPRQSGQYGFVLPRFIRQAVAGDPITVFGDGRQTRSFCDVRDTIAILDVLGGAPQAAGQVVNVGNTQEVSILDLAVMVKRCTGSSSPIEFISYENAYGKKFDHIPQRRPILDKLVSLTGYRHQFELERTIEDIAQNMAPADDGAIVDDHIQTVVPRRAYA